LLGLLEKNAIASFETLQNLLSWGKSQIKGVTLAQTVFDANGAAGSERRLISNAAEDKAIQITNNMPDGVMVYADMNHYKFIMRNLLSNAVKYTKNGGTIEISAKPDNKGFVVFSVADNGVGMAADVCKNIFNSFGKSVPGTENEHGNGIGLKLCQEFVEQNGGRIWVESEQGKGSTFFFSLKEGK
jgi:signal transduction histidine kinase